MNQFLSCNRPLRHIFYAHFASRSRSFSSCQLSWIDICRQKGVVCVSFFFIFSFMCIVLIFLLFDLTDMEQCHWIKKQIKYDFLKNCYLTAHGQLRTTIKGAVSLTQCIYLFRPEVRREPRNELGFPNPSKAPGGVPSLRHNPLGLWNLICTNFKGWIINLYWD